MATVEIQLYRKFHSRRRLVDLLTRKNSCFPILTFLYGPARIFIYEKAYYFKILKESVEQTP